MLSFPKEKIKVLLLENIHDSAVNTFEREGYQVEVFKKALVEEELKEKIKDIHLLGIRSNTKLTKEVLAKARHLHAIGAFCIGVNQIDLSAASRGGSAVFNAPYSNTRSVVELAVSEMISLSRKTTLKSFEVHQGIWEKSAAGSNEIRGKRLGIVGYGNIGKQLSVLAENLGMQVYYYDIKDTLALGNARKCQTLDELLSVSDIVTLHVDGHKDNTDLFSKKEFNKMQKGALFLNLARGHVVDEEALRNALQSGHLRGAAVDVFKKEPKSSDEKFSSPLQNLDNVILTPHVGGSTEEAQANIGQFVSDKLINFINSGNTSLSVNLPNLSLPALDGAHRLIHLHHNVPGVLAKINNILAEEEVNILGQYLGTTDELGYVTTDVDQAYSKELQQKLKSLEETIRLRVLY